jgi:regulator of protease activity HflC (stomatin/prohibitin superfamily)
VIERTRWVNLQVDTADIPTQDLITEDNVTIRVEAAVFYRVVDPLKAVLAIRDDKHGVLRIAQTTLRATLGQHDSTTCSPTRRRTTRSSSTSSTPAPRRGASTSSRSRRRTWGCRTR